MQIEAQKKQRLLAKMPKRFTSKVRVVLNALTSQSMKHLLKAFDYWRTI